MYHYHNLLDEMLKMLKGFNEQEVYDFPAYKVRLHLRDKLIMLGIADDLANRAAAAPEITVPLVFNENNELMDTLLEVVDEMAILIVKFHSAAMKDFGSSDEIFLKLLDGTNLKLE